LLRAEDPAVTLKLIAKVLPGDPTRGEQLSLVMYGVVDGLEVAGLGVAGLGVAGVAGLGVAGLAVAGFGVAGLTVGGRGVAGLGVAGLGVEGTPPAAQFGPMMELHMHWLAWLHVAVLPALDEHGTRS